MASLLVIGEKGDTEIYYSITDGKVFAFELNGKVLYDRKWGLETEGWKDKLVQFVKELIASGDIDAPRHAFVQQLVEEGLIEFNEADDEEEEFTMGAGE